MNVVVYAKYITFFVSACTVMALAIAPEMREMESSSKNVYSIFVNGYTKENGFLTRRAIL